MSYRPGSHFSRSRRRARPSHDSPLDDFPPLPAPRLPSLRALAAARRERESEAALPLPLLPTVTSPAAGPDQLYQPQQSQQNQPPFWPSAAARRAERIRNIENRAPSVGLDGLSSTLSFSLDRSMDEGWPLPTPASVSNTAAAASASRRADRIRSSATADARPTTTTTTTTTTNFEDLDRTLEEANSHLRSLLDLQTHTTHYLQHHSAWDQSPPTPRAFSSSAFSPLLRPNDLPHSDPNHRSKRRKLDSDRLVPSSKGFRYGKYGQVEPGQLQMEIVSCDGGMFSNELSFAADNILRDDDSVYCTKGNRCNIVLRHQGSTPFTLRELVIKAPASMNYSHPVREGMVFIAMEQDDALRRTAQYQIQYSPRSGDERSSHPTTDPEASLFWDVATEVVSIQHHDDGTTTRRAHPMTIPHSYRESSRDEEPDAECRIPSMPPEFQSNIPEFRVTTECSSDEGEDGADLGPLRFLRRAPNRIGSLPFEAPDSDSEMPNVFGPDLLERHRALMRSHEEHTSSSRRARRRAQAHNESREREREQERDSTRPGLSLTEAWEAHTSATQDALRAVGSPGLLAPHARFFIEKNKSKCTIRFDPPVSGRFILLKMWSSHHDPSSNIDIQSVIARGYAGPRYFPSTQLR